MIEPKNILIIGGRGFIGTRLARECVAKGDNVTVIDDLSNALSIIIKNDAYTSIANSIENINSINIENNQFDIIYHLASESRPLEFHSNHRKIVSSNVVGLLELLDFMKLNNLNEKCKLVYASSSEVYGSNSSNLEEGMPSIIKTSHQRNIYSISKMLSESILFNSENVNFSIARFFNVYGPENREDDTKLIPMLMKAVQQKIPFEICGSGHQVRSFTFISDIVQGLIMMGEYEHSGDVFNLGNAHSVHSVLDLVKKVQSIHPKLEVKHVAGRKGEPFVRKVDSSKAEDLLHWEPLMSFEQGIDLIFGKL